MSKRAAARDSSRFRREMSAPRAKGKRKISVMFYGEVLSVKDVPRGAPERSSPFFSPLTAPHQEYLQASVVWKKSDSVKGATPLTTLRHGSGAFADQFFSFDATLFTTSSREVSPPQRAPRRALFL